MTNGIPEEFLGVQARIERAIAAKQAAQRPDTDGNQPVYQYDDHGRLISVNGNPVPRPAA